MFKNLKWMNHILCKLVWDHRDGLQKKERELKEVFLRKYLCTGYGSLSVIFKIHGYLFHERENQEQWSRRPNYNDERHKSLRHSVHFPPLQVILTQYIYMGSHIINVHQDPIFYKKCSSVLDFYKGFCVFFDVLIFTKPFDSILTFPVSKS